MDPEFIINNIPSRIVCTVVVYAGMYTAVATNSLYTIYCSNSIFQHGSHIRSVFMSSCKATIYSSGLSFVSIISERHSTKTTLDTIITLNGKVRLNRFSDPAIFRPCVLHHVFQSCSRTISALAHCVENRKKSPLFRHIGDSEFRSHHKDDAQIELSERGLMARSVPSSFHV